MPFRLPGYLFLSLLFLQACSDPTSPDVVVEMPFDPSGTWEASIDAIRDDEHFSGPLILRLSILGTYAPPHGMDLLVELHGTWRWGGLTGDVDGFWNAGPTTDEDARDSEGGCPMYYTVCSLNLTLERPLPEVYGEEGGLGGLAPIWLQGWFEGPTRMVAAELKGTFWEGRFADRPCTGPTLISLDTTAVLVRAPTD